jgi:hypothetical protein
MAAVKEDKGHPQDDQKDNKKEPEFGTEEAEHKVGRDF